VRKAIEVEGPPYPDLDVVARALGTSARTLRRRLSEEGTSFRGLLEDVRIARADDWLTHGDRSITQIGLELGYADSANFTRAYRRARGMTPLAARRSATDDATR
jgi:AraC-like DNA-binding protein